MEKDKVLLLVNQVALKLEVECYLVGGYLRDQLKGLASEDLDFSISDKLEEFVRELALTLKSDYNTYPEFLTASIKLNLQLQKSTKLSSLDFCQFRKEKYSAPGKLPDISKGDLRSDIERRDFTINSLAVPLSLYIQIQQGEFFLAGLRKILYDPFSGLVDLDSGVLRVFHAKSFEDDPTRIFRGARYKVLINGTYHPETLEHLRSAIESKEILTVASYRIRNELLAIAKSSLSKEIVVELLNIGLFTSLFNFENIKLPILTEAILKVSLVGEPEIDLCSLLAPIIDAYQGTRQIKILGLKRSMNRKIIELITNVNN